MSGRPKNHTKLYLPGLVVLIFFTIELALPALINPLPSSETIGLSSDKEVLSSYTGNFNPYTYTGRFGVLMMASPDNCYNGIVQILRGAEKSIYISVYTLSSPYILEVLIDRLEKGVDIKLLLEKEQVNWYERNYNRWTMMNLTEISHNGNYAEGRWANSSKRENHPDDITVFDYQHCKYAVVDNNTLILSSGNWGKSSCPKPQDDGDVDGNRDWWVAVYGNVSTASAELVDYFTDLFFYDWDLGYPYNSSVDGMGFAQTYDRSGSSYNPFPLKYAEGDMSITPVLSPDNSYSSIRSLISSATESLYIEEMYITAGLDELVDDIIARKEAGVDVRIILSDSGSDNETVYRLLKAGIPVKRSVANMSAPNPNPFDTMHNKGIIIDGKKVLISSINWSPTSFFKNREAGLIIVSESVGAYYTELFDYDWGASEWWDADFSYSEDNVQPPDINTILIFVAIAAVIIVVLYIKSRL